MVYDIRLADRGAFRDDNGVRRLGRAACMIVYLNGRFLPEERAMISIQDRGFLYGDGLFETARFYDGHPFLWEEHMARWTEGCARLNISPPLSGRELLVVGQELLRRNLLKNALLRITISRGPGRRGYSPKDADFPTVCLTPYAAAENLPEFFKLITSTVRLPKTDSLAGFKHANKLRQILAKAEADAAGANEALLLDEKGGVLEGTSTNVFWLLDGKVFTPPVGGILPGIARRYVLRLCSALGIQSREQEGTVEEIVRSEGVFVTSSGIEIMKVGQIDRYKVRRSPLVAKLKARYRREPA
jgi:aminodeoxychorismate lyase